jgi:hypothetical protein
VAPHKKGARRRKATLVFVDESGFSQRPSVRRTWAPKGQTPTVDDHVNWQRLSAIGGIAWRPGEAPTRLFLSLHRGSVKQPQILAYLRSLRRHLRGPVVLIWDNLSAHRGCEVREYVARNASWLRVEFLPPYAPELNPVEQLWSNFDAQELANYTPDDLSQLAGQIERGKRRIRKANHGLMFIKHCDLISDREFKLIM